MDRKNRPVGRSKKVGSGSSSVFRRGSGLGRKTQGPVGNYQGYSGRDDRPQQYSTTGQTPVRRTGGVSLKTIIIMAIIAYLAFKFLGGGMGNLLGGGGTQDTSNFLQSQTETADTYVDSGSHEVSEAVSNEARDKRTVLKGGGEDTVTIMVYMLGTDLESRGGMATADLNEMVYANVSDKVNIIVETGGTKKWQNNVISSTTNQRYKVTSEGVIRLEDNLGRKSMVDPDTLTDFIKYASDKFPADRNILVMWDHGGGSLTGYGYDEYVPGDHMTLDEISDALTAAGTTFDIIGFDACLMGTLETAMVLEPHADYMIASEEVEPGIGWYYTGWISTLSGNTSIPTIDLGKKLIDDYVSEVAKRTPQSQATLSLIDLAELKGTVPEALYSFASSTRQLIDDKEYKVISDARAGAKEFSKQNQLNQVDLIDFVEKIDTEESRAFAEVLRGVVKYNRTSSNITNANGVSIYFPYYKLTSTGEMLETYDEIGFDDEYSEFVRSFASVVAGGQVSQGGGGNLLQTLLTGATSQSAPSGTSVISTLLQTFLQNGDYSGISGIAGSALGWLNGDAVESSAEYYAENQFDQTELVITEKNGERVLALSEKNWDLVQYMEMNVFIDDGEGFIDLGLDNVYEFNDDGDLVMEYDGTWLSMNGNIVSYYMISDDHHGDNYSIKGRVPAMLNGEKVDIMIVFDNANPYGKVLGASLDYDENDSGVLAKGLIDIAAGDEIDFLCDYYTYDGDYEDTYYLGNRYEATGNWNIENISIRNLDFQMTYRITDIYNNKYWTPVIDN